MASCYTSNKPKLMIIESLLTLQFPPATQDLHFSNRQMWPAFGPWHWLRPLPGSYSLPHHSTTPLRGIPRPFPPAHCYFWTHILFYYLLRTFQDLTTHLLVDWLPCSLECCSRRARIVLCSLNAVASIAPSAYRSLGHSFLSERGNKWMNESMNKWMNEALSHLSP